MRAALAVFAAVVIAVGVFVYLDPGGKGSAVAVASAGRLATCRTVCRCEPGKPCEPSDCYDDCHPPDPKVCVREMTCPDGWSWSKSECSCRRR